MNEHGERPRTATVIDAELAQHSIDSYFEAWNEPDSIKRARLLTEVMADDGGYCDPAERVAGSAGIVEYIGEVLSAYPGARIVRTSEVDVHHLFGRFTWRLIRSDGTRLQDSVDFVEFSDDGRIYRVTGFFGIQKPDDAP